MPGIAQRNAEFGNASLSSIGSVSTNGIWSKNRCGNVTFDQLQKFWSELSPQARQELLKIDKQTLFEQARKNLYCSRCNGLLLEGFSQIVAYGRSLLQEGAGGHYAVKGVQKNKIKSESDIMSSRCQDDIPDPSVHPWGGLVATRDGTLTLLDCFLDGKSLKALQNVFDSACARERERELLYPDACGGGGRGWISQGMANYGRGHGTRETCALHTARLSCDTLVDFWSALGDESRQSLLRMKEEDFIERLMYRFDSKRFCRDCRRNVIREFKELKELKRMRREPRCTNWFCVADTAFQCEVSNDSVLADWHRSFTDSDGAYHHFEWAIGTGEGKSDLLEFEDVGMNGSVEVNGLDLGGVSSCFITLRAWKLDGRCTELTVKAHALKGQACVHRRLIVGDGYVTITKGDNIRSFFEHAEEAEEEEDDDSIDKDGNELDGDGSRPQKHAKSPELAREFLLDAATVIFKEQVEKAFREGTARQNAHSIFVCLALKLLEGRVHVACKPKEEMESFLLSSSSSPTTRFSHSSLSLSKRSLFFKSPPSISLSPPSRSPSTLRSSSSSSSSFSTFSSPFFFIPSKPKHSPIRASSSSKPTQSPNPNPNPQGAKFIPLVISVAVGLIVRFIVPKPAEVSLQAWQLLSIFLSTIAGLVLSPLPVGAWAFLGLTASIVTRTLSFSTAFGAFTNEVIWLIVISFFFARGFVKTGLGDRIATYFVKWLGKSTLGLSYGLTISEAIIAPAMPSTTARAGGVFLPIIKSLSLSAGSRPGDPTAKRLGSYLIQSQFQSGGNSSALFLTAAAQNLLCLKLAEELGVKIASPWVSWFKFASLPAIVSLLATPYILYKVFPPETKDTPDAPAMATKKLEQMGPVKRNEWVMIGTMLLAVSLWVFGDTLGIASVVAAMLGLSILLLLGVLDWDDCLGEKSAWDTLAWFAVLVGMAGQLTNLGIVSWMSDSVAKSLHSFSLSWPAAFCVLQAAYFSIHYLFASQTGHVGALYSAFLAMNLAAGVPGVLAALALAYNTNLFGALTHYSSGQAAVYYGAGYLELPDVFKMGFLMAVVNAVIWGVVGTFWWKFLGLY